MMPDIRKRSQEMKKDRTGVATAERDTPWTRHRSGYRKSRLPAGGEQPGDSCHGGRKTQKFKAQFLSQKCCMIL